MSTGQRIQKMRKALGLTQIELGKKVGVSGVTVGNWEKNEHIPKGEFLVLLAEALQTTPDHIISGTLKHKKTYSELRVHEPLPVPYMSPIKVPLISSVTAGKWMEIIDSFQPIDADQWQETTAKVSKKAFALRAEGKSMQNPNGYPTVPQGSIVIVDPEIEATNGKVVVAKLPRSNEATIKRLVIDGPMLYLEPLNPEFKQIPINEECIIIGVVKQVIQDI